MMRTFYAAFSIVTALLLAAPAGAQEPDADTAAPFTVFPHPEQTRWWLSGQINLIDQRHGPFAAAYNGEHSLRPRRERSMSRVWTIYTGVQLSPRTEFLFDLESAAGRGISDAFGLAGFTNLDVVRNPDLGPAPYVARAMVHHVIALNREQVAVARGPLSLATRLPARRLEIRAGKLGIVDFFDLNAVGSDSHLQFTNWTVDNNGAYDYAADTRGYTFGVIVEWVNPHWTLRAAEVLMPKVANGIVLDWHVTRARGDNVEFEWRPVPRFVSRTLGYVNHANMGSYDEAIAAYQSGAEQTPDIEAHRRQGRRKYGAGQNVEYTLLNGVRLFARTGWNEGHHESFAYTEVNNTVLAGGDVTGAGWRRPGDRVGLAGVSNGLSVPHRDYLRLGGLGFLLGDGGLRYGRESIVEGYYTAHVWRGVFVAGGAQYIVNPGFNRDRGPVLIGTLRLHADF